MSVATFSICLNYTINPRGYGGKSERMSCRFQNRKSCSEQNRNDFRTLSCRPYASPLFVFSVDSKDAATTMVIRRKDGGRFPKRPCSFTKKTAVFFLGDRRLNASTACGNPTISPSLILILLIGRFCNSLSTLEGVLKLPLLFRRRRRGVVATHLSTSPLLRRRL